MRAALALAALLAATPAAHAADMQQCRAEEGLRERLVSMKQAGKTAAEAVEILAKQIMAQNPPPLGLGLYLQPLAIEVYLLGDSPGRIVAACYSEASDRPATGSTLTADQRGAIGDHVRECWSTDPGMPDLNKMKVLLTVTTDANGVARQAVVAPEDLGRVAADPSLRMFSERAVRAVLSPQCANLPLPQSMLGNANVVTFRFSP